MGSTLAPSGTWSGPISEQLIQSPTLLSHTERVVFLGCPADLLRIILFITSLRHAEASAYQVPSSKPDVGFILSQINNFEPERWAQKMKPHMPTGNSSVGSNDPNEQISPFEATYRLASAFKIAVTLYATRVLLHPSPIYHPFTEQVGALLTHLSFIAPASELFKSILWPTFIAGTECRIPQQQAYIRDRLETLWRDCFTVNIKAASKVLDAIWTRENESDGEGDWIDFFDRSDANWLFI